MDTNSKKPQQNFSNKQQNSAKSSQFTDRKGAELQLNKPWPRNSRRREQPAVSLSRNEQTRNNNNNNSNNNNTNNINNNSNNSKQYPSAKVRTNVDKRPRPRGSAGNAGVGNGTGGTDIQDPARLREDLAAAGTGLALEQAVAHATSMGGGAVSKRAYRDTIEFNSVYAHGSKKQNLNHLLNFHYTPRESDYTVDGSLNIFGRGSSASSSNAYRGAARKPKFNKEQFMQANFQFVIKSCAKRTSMTSPDTLIDWNLIEQINIQTTEEPQCPICLYPPIAAKVTRCGHAYCWPCLLHYLALSDKTWRKCPICYEAVHMADLKSTVIVQQRPVNVGDEITFELMRRKKGSMCIEKFSKATGGQRGGVTYFPPVSTDDDMKLFSKLLIAKHADILHIIERERLELTKDEDPSCPQHVFIQQALNLLRERRDKLMASHDPVAELEDNSNDEPDEAKADTEKIEEYSAEDSVDRVDGVDGVDGLGDVACADDDAVEKPAADNRALTPTTTARGVGGSVGGVGGGSAADPASVGAIKYYYFYQSQDGQNIFLHPLNVKMLQACYGTLEYAPHVISAHVLQKEHHSMDEYHRRKFTCLGHLPLTCQFAVVEVALQSPIIHDAILRLFRDDIQFRKKERQRRDREERKRERHINEINDRQMGKLIASAANLNLSSAQEFPTCGFEESLFGVNADDTVGSGGDGGVGGGGAAALRSSYLTVALDGRESLQADYWPTIQSAPAHTTTTYNSYQELSIWGKAAGATTKQRTISERSNESDSTAAAPLAVAQPMRTNLSDVLAEAMLQKRHSAASNGANGGCGGGGGSGGAGGGGGGGASGSNGSGAGNGHNSTVGAGRKNKKGKKMQPLFSTGINYNGN